jgi:glycosyltransferase involved in cell wall biosynthesis
MTWEVHLSKSDTARRAVSVIVPALGAGAGVADALASVFAQTFTDFEVVVVHDGSPDAAAVEAAIGPFRSRIHFIVQHNRGAAAARNTAIRASSGRLVAFLDADDRWMPEFLARQVALLESDRRRALVYCDARFSGDTSTAGRTFTAAWPSEGDVTLVSLIRQRTEIALSTVVARRRPLVAAGMFDETLRGGHDLDLWLRLAWRGAPIVYHREVLVERRLRAEGRRSEDAIRAVERALHVLDRFGRDRVLDTPARTALRIRIMALVDRSEIEQGKQRFLEGNFAAAQYHLGAARERPLTVRLALLGLRLSPRLLRSAYLRFRPA